MRNPKGVNGGPDLIKMRTLAAPEIAEIGSMMLDRNVTELQAIVDDAKSNPTSKHSALKVWMATIAMRGITKGDPYALDALLNRIAGKVSYEVKVTEAEKPAGTAVALLSPEERRAKIEQYQRMITESKPEVLDNIIDVESTDVTPKEG